MNMPALNLLRYPRRGWVLPARQWRSLWLALGAGALFGAGGVAWLQGHLQQLQAQRNQWQAEVQALAEQQAAADASRAQRQLLQAVEARALEWQAKRAQLDKLNHTLGDQARSLGLRVQRWQADGRQLVLQGWLPRAQDVPALVSALSSAGPPGWALHSLGEPVTSSSGSGVDVLLQAPWPPRGPEKDKVAP